MLVVQFASFSCSLHSSPAYCMLLLQFACLPACSQHDFSAVCIFLELACFSWSLHARCQSACLSCSLHPSLIVIMSSPWFFFSLYTFYCMLHSSPLVCMRLLQSKDSLGVCIHLQESTCLSWRLNVSTLVGILLLQHACYFCSLHAASSVCILLNLSAFFCGMHPSPSVGRPLL